MPMNQELVVDVETAFECTQVQAQMWIAARETLAIQLAESHRRSCNLAYVDWMRERPEYRDAMRLDAQKIMAQASTTQS